MKQRFTNWVLGAALVGTLSVLWVPATAYGAPVQPDPGLVLPGATQLSALPELFKGNDIGKTFGSLWELVIAASAVVFLVLLLIGGVTYLTAAGNDESTKKAKTLLTDAVIGIVLVVVAWPVGLFILAQLGLTNASVLGESATKGGEKIEIGPDANPKQTISITPSGESLGIETTGKSVAVGDAGNGGSIGVQENELRIKLTNSQQGVILYWVPIIGLQKGNPITLTTDEEGETAVKGTTPGTDYQIENEIHEILHRGTIEGNAGMMVWVDPGKKAENLVRVRIIIYDHLVTSTPLKNFTFGLSNDAVPYNQIFATNAAGQADLLLDPGVTYSYVDAGTGDVAATADRTFTVGSTLPKNTDNPADTWTLFVTQTSGSSAASNPTVTSKTVGDNTQYTTKTGTTSHTFLYNPTDGWYWDSGATSGTRYYPVGSLPSTLSAEQKSEITTALGAAQSYASGQ